MPTLLDATILEAQQREVQGATQGRMQRELAEGLEALAVEQPLVLLLEDLHWSDPSTVELLAMVARRREAARLLLLGTYRPAELIATDHPLKAAKQELVARKQAVELQLGPLDIEAVRQYVTQRLERKTDEESLAAFVYQRTEGHPLFMVQITEYLRQHGGLLGVASADESSTSAIEQAVPEGLCELIEAQLGRLPADEQRIMEVASVAGAEFAVASLTAGSQTSVDAVETACANLARHKQFIEDRGLATWPDGTVGGRYGFRHALYRDVLANRLGAGQRARLHLRVGQRLAAGYGERANEIAAELALHFEQGGDVQQAVRYRHRAAQNALRRSAHQEAIGHLNKGLALLRTLADTAERAQQEIVLQAALGGTLMAVRGWAVPEVGKAYARARDLCRRIGEEQELFSALSGLFGFHLVRGELQTALGLAEEMLELAQRVRRSGYLVRSHGMLGMTLHYLGRLSPAHAQLEQGIAFYDPRRHHPRISGALQDFGVVSRCYLSSVLWLRGYPDRAVQRIAEALSLAQELSHPFSLAWACAFAARLHLLRGERHAACQQAEALLAVASKHDFALWKAEGEILLGSALPERERAQEGIIRIQAGLIASGGAGRTVDKPFYLGLLAEAHAITGQPVEGLAALTEALALVDATDERWYEAELHRLRGELILQQASRARASGGARARARSNAPQSEAEVCFRDAIEVARGQQAKSLELRATMSLARLWRQHGRTTEAHQIVTEACGWFSEGLGTKDLQDAKTLLTTLTEQQCVQGDAESR